MSVNNFWSLLKRRFMQAGGGSLSVTLHSLTLSSQNTKTRQYDKAYSNSTIDMIISDKRTIIDPTPVGQLERVVASGMTDTQIYKGDCITDGDGNEWEITDAWEVSLGSTTIMYMCSLERAVSRTDVSYPYPAPPTEGGISIAVGIAYFTPLTLACLLSIGEFDVPQVASVSVTDSFSTSFDVSTACSISATDAFSTSFTESNACSISTIMNVSVV